MRSPAPDRERRRRGAMAIALVSVLAFAGCGSDDRPEVSLPTASTDTSTTVASGSSTSETTTTEAPTTTRPPLTTTTREPLTTTTREPLTTTTTEAPATTDSPTTTTAAAETSTTELAAAPADATSDDGGTSWWPWLLVAALMIGLIAWFATRGQRRTAKWRQQVAVALDDATRVATHLAAVAPEGAAMVAIQDAPGLADLGARLSTLADEAADAPARQAIAALRDQVQVLHGVVDGIAMGSTPASETTLAYLREQATALHSAAARARATVLPAPTVAGTTASS